jgi:hypothetical protein
VQRLPVDGHALSRRLCRGPTSHALPSDGPRLVSDGDQTIQHFASSRILERAHSLSSFIQKHSKTRVESSTHTNSTQGSSELQNRKAHAVAFMTLMSALVSQFPCTETYPSSTLPRQWATTPLCSEKPWHSRLSGKTSDLSMPLQTIVRVQGNIFSTFRVGARMFGTIRRSPEPTDLACASRPFSNSGRNLTYYTWRSG